MATEHQPCPDVIKQGTELGNLTKQYDSLAKDVKEIKEKLLGRPTWAVTVVIAFLSTLSFSALTFAFTIIHSIDRGKF
jgi:hypothetical protein